MAIALIHYSYTHKDGRCLVIAPMKSHVELIYQEILRLAAKNEIVMNSITRKVTSPQFMIQFTNGSTIRFFTSGMRSGGKSDVARGQEAHMIVLDEMDYMHADDLDALYAMLQKTAEDQPDKVLIGASTPTGRRERFWEWCRSTRFKEFWFPSYCNPYFTKDQEDEFREQYSELGYRHEIEADWGEDSEGVYPRKYVDKAFMEPGWEYKAELTSARSFHTIGVDWDKYGAGTNIVVLEVCSDTYEEERFRNKVKICYREEIPKSEYTLTKAVSRIVEYTMRGNADLLALLLCIQFYSLQPFFPNQRSLLVPQRQAFLPRCKPGQDDNASSATHPPERRQQQPVGSARWSCQAHA
jgi:replicative DNA helicase